MVSPLISIHTSSPGLHGLVFYVSTHGNDSWSGTIPDPNPQMTDGPFRTVERAQRAVREARRQGDAQVTVLIRGGVYELRQPLVFTHDDGGSEQSPVTYAAYQGERPVFWGGVRIQGWQKLQGELWVAKIPELEGGEWCFHQLFANGHRQTRARTPNEGYVRTVGPLPAPSDSKMGFRYREGDLKRWTDLEDVNIFLYHSWTCSLHWIQELDEQNLTVRFTNPCDWPVGYWEAQQRYHLENFLDALDSPGEWYLDQRTGTLYFWPPDGQDPNQMEVVAPRLQNLVVLDGNVTAGLTVNHIIFRGLSFQYADWKVDRYKPVDGQAATFLSAAVVARGARNCVLEECEIAHVGEYGVILGEGCKHNRIVHCEIHDLGGGGIRIGEGVLRKAVERQADHNTVDNCFIHDGGHVFMAGVGIWIGKSSYNTASHNEICDFYYTGVSVGWSWGYDASSANNNVIEYNHIHDIGKGVLSDMGGVYTLGVSPGTVVRSNLIHDVYSYSYGGWGLYTDEGSSQIVLEANVVYNTKSGSFHQHYGRENLLRNNILGPALEPTIIRTRQEEHISFILQRNIIVSSNAHVLGGAWTNSNYRLDYNLYWDLNNILGEDMDFAGVNFQRWQTAGNDQHSIVANPLFVDPEHDDYRLLNRSPALDLGFEPPDLENIGLYGEEEWVEAPKRLVRKPLPQFLRPRLVRAGAALHPENLSQVDPWIFKFDPSKGKGAISPDTTECVLVWTVDLAKLPSPIPPGSQVVNGSCQTPMKRGLDGLWYALVQRQKVGAVYFRFRDGMLGGGWDDNDGSGWWIASPSYVGDLLSELRRVTEAGARYGADMHAYAACLERANAHYLEGNLGQAMNEIDGNLDAAGLQYARQLLDFASRELDALRGKGIDLSLQERLVSLAALMVRQGIYRSAEDYCLKALEEISKAKASIRETLGAGGVLFIAVLLTLRGRRREGKRH